MKKYLSKYRLGIFFLLSIMITSMVLSGCSSTDTTKTDQSEKRTIVDLTGKEVIIPPASEINRVVIVAPPLVATYASVVKDTEKLVGIHPTAINVANKSLLDLVIPNWQSINTAFLSGFTSNTEEVLKMNPDIILVYGESQKKGLENVNVPIVDFYLDDPENENWSVKIDILMREIFEIKEENTLQKEWDEANKIVDEALKHISDTDKKTAIMVRDNTQGSFSVRGMNYYGDDWLVKTGLINAAGNLAGDSAQITMEQLYQWNPDIVYDFVGQDADAYLQNTIEGQDWSQVTASKNKAIYDMPQGMFNWGAPNVDSPLTLIWMTMKNYPDTISQESFKDYMKAFYKRQYDIDLTDALFEEILDPVK